MLVIALYPGRVHAWSCVSLSEDGFLKNSDYVFDGYVHHHRLLERKSDSVWGKASVYIFKILDIKKGAKRFYVEIRVPPAIGSCGGMVYLKNVRYRVNAIEINGKLHSGFCSSWRVDNDKK